MSDVKHPFTKFIVHFDESWKGPRGERLHVLEDDGGHQLILLQPLSELGDGETFDAIAAQFEAAPETAAERDRLAKKIERLREVIAEMKEACEDVSARLNDQIGHPNDITGARGVFYEALCKTLGDAAALAKATS